MFQQI